MQAPWLVRPPPQMMILVKIQENFQEIEDLRAPSKQYQDVP